MADAGAESVNAYADVGQRDVVDAVAGVEVVAATS